MKDDFGVGKVGEVEVRCCHAAKTGTVRIRTATTGSAPELNLDVISFHHLDLSRFSWALRQF